jgi:hypothetical protein
MSGTKRECIYKLHDEKRTGTVLPLHEVRKIHQLENKLEEKLKAAKLQHPGPRTPSAADGTVPRHCLFHVCSLARSARFI